MLLLLCSGGRAEGSRRSTDCATLACAIAVVLTGGDRLNPLSLGRAFLEGDIVLGFSGPSFFGRCTSEGRGREGGGGVAALG